MDTSMYIWTHMDTQNGYIWGPKSQAVAQNWRRGPGVGGGGPGSHGPWPCPGSLGPWPCPWALALALSMGPGPRRQFCATAWLLGPHMYPFYVSMCVHMYIDVSICILFIFLTRSMSKSKIVSSYLASKSENGLIKSSRQVSRPDSLFFVLKNVFFIYFLEAGGGKNNSPIKSGAPKVGLIGALSAP